MRANKLCEEFAEDTGVHEWNGLKARQSISFLIFLCVVRHGWKPTASQNEETKFILQEGGPFPAMMPLPLVFLQDGEWLAHSACHLP